MWAPTSWSCGRAIMADLSSRHLFFLGGLDAPPGTATPGPTVRRSAGVEAANLANAVEEGRASPSCALARGPKPWAAQVRTARRVVPRTQAGGCVRRLARGAQGASEEAIRTGGVRAARHDVGAGDGPGHLGLDDHGRLVGTRVPAPAEIGTYSAARRARPYSSPPITRCWTRTWCATRHILGEARPRHRPSNPWVLAPHIAAPRPKYRSRRPISPTLARNCEASPSVSSPTDASSAGPPDTWDATRPCAPATSPIAEPLATSRSSTRPPAPSSHDRPGLRRRPRLPWRGLEHPLGHVHVLSRVHRAAAPATRWLRALPEAPGGTEHPGRRAEGAQASSIIIPPASGRTTRASPRSGGAHSLRTRSATHTERRGLR